MIITSAKPLEEILSMLKDEDNIFVIGCNVCAAKLKTGGEPEVLEMCRKLEERGKHVVGWCLPTAACSIRSFDSLAEKNEKINDASCVIVMGCGSGVSAVASVVDCLYMVLTILFHLAAPVEGNCFLISVLCVGIVL
jgi:hypothetical protein